MAEMREKTIKNEDKRKERGEERCDRQLVHKEAMKRSEH